MRIAGWPNPGSSWRWRLEGPFKYLQRLGHEAIIFDTGITEEIAQWADLYVLHGCVDKDGIALLHAYQQERGKRLVVDVDDMLEVEDHNPYKVDHEVYQAAAVVRATISVADLVTTTTRRLQHYLTPLTNRTIVLPNLLDLERWDVVRPRPQASETVRVGWAGSITHYEDLAMIAPAITRLAAQYPQVRLVLVGDTRLKELFPKTRVEVMPGVPFDVWPAKLAGLGFDIGLAPLRDTPFNRCKSNIKWLEYAIAKIPGVYSPIPYNFRGFDGTFGQIAATEEEWFRCLENLILYPQLREDIANRAYSHVRRHCDLKRHVHRWDEAYRSLT